MLVQFIFGAMIFACNNNNDTIWMVSFVNDIKPADYFFLQWNGLWNLYMCFLCNSMMCFTTPKSSKILPWSFQNYAFGFNMPLTQNGKGVKFLMYPSYQFHQHKIVYHFAAKEIPTGGFLRFWAKNLCLLAKNLCLQPWVCKGRIDYN